MIASPHNPIIKRVRVLQARRREREADGVFVIEGARLFAEAARSGAAPRLILHRADLDARGRAALEALAARGGDVHIASPAALAVASDTETPSGLVAVVPIPRTSPPPSLRFALVLDGLADPGNLGTILRTADAAGVEAVFLTAGSVDAYNPKVVRAAMGAHFRLPIAEMGWDALKERLAGLIVWLAEARAGPAYDQVDWRAPCALVIGSEADGPSPAAQAFTPHRVHVPMPGRAESLNAAVAAGVLLFAAARQKPTAAARVDNVWSPT
jgi:TrmH family RNA methyltransferase